MAYLFLFYLLSFFFLSIGGGSLATSTHHEQGKTARGDEDFRRSKTKKREHSTYSQRKPRLWGQEGVTRDFFPTLCRLRSVGGERRRDRRGIDGVGWFTGDKRERERDGLQFRVYYHYDIKSSSLRGGPNSLVVAHDEIFLVAAHHGL